MTRGDHHLSTIPANLVNSTLFQKMCGERIFFSSVGEITKCKGENIIDEEVI